MKIVSIKQHHDGTIALVDSAELKFSIEAEKGSGKRYGTMEFSKIMEILHTRNITPDVLAFSGWGEHYYGLELPSVDESIVLGRECKMFISSHERSHVLGAYGMSPFEQGKPCYCLVWEGGLGSFYYIDESVNITCLGTPLLNPGARYACLYNFAVATEGRTFSPDMPRPSVDQLLSYGGVKTFLTGIAHSLAGKIMALASYGKDEPRTEEEDALIEALLEIDIMSIEELFKSVAKHGDDISTPAALTAWFDENLRNRPDLRKFTAAVIPFLGVGVESQAFCNLAQKVSDAIYDKFFDFAKENLTDGHPLLISGGCGLNCEWNTRFKHSGLFEEVFVPPCANDSGSAIGTAIDAQFYYTGNAKISWDVYAGDEFEVDIDDDQLSNEFDIEEKTHERVAQYLSEGKIFGWVSGKWEIGPRALGNRSIIAAPFDTATQDRLNEIKQREKYRPVAPMCMEEHASEYFDFDYSSPYMLHFHQVKEPKLKTITHVDNSARAQTINESQNADVYKLLKAFKEITGYGVLCNTSLNFIGKGFINTLSDLREYVISRKIDGMIANGKIYLRKG